MLKIKIELNYKKSINQNKIMNTTDSCFYNITSIVLDNRSINKDDTRYIALCSMKKCMNLVRNFVETYPSNEYAITGFGRRYALHAKTFNELNSQQRANFNAIVEMYNELAS